MADLHSQDYQIRFKRGAWADVNAEATKAIALDGEPHYVTDQDALFVFNGTRNVPVVAQLPLRTVDGAYTITDDDVLVIVADSGGGSTITLPTAVGRDGRVYTVKRTDGGGGVVTLEGDGAETIDGAASVTLSQWDVYRVVSDGSNWLDIT